MDDGYFDRCRFSHMSYGLLLDLFSCALMLPDCIPSCSRYQPAWNNGIGCKGQFDWYMYPTPAACPCRDEQRAADSGDGMSDDDVVVVKQEEYEDNVQQGRLFSQQSLLPNGAGEAKVPEAEAEAEPGAAVAAKEEEYSDDEEKVKEEEEEEEEEEQDEAEREWTAILPVPLHYLCLRTLTTPAFRIFLRAAMGQSGTEDGVHVIMHQQPCDARTPLKWGHVVLYGTREEVHKGKRALCAVMDSGYQHRADGRLLVQVVQSMNQQAAWEGQAADLALMAGGEWNISPQDFDNGQSGEPARRRRRVGSETEEEEEEDEVDNDDDTDWTAEDGEQSADELPPRFRRRFGPSSSGEEEDDDDDESWASGRGYDLGVRSA